MEIQRQNSLTLKSTTVYTAQAVEGGLLLTWSDGQTGCFPSIWLRDNLPDARPYAGGQKLFDIALLEGEVSIAEARVTEGGRVAVTFAPENLTALFDPKWLRRHCLEEAADRRRLPHLWRAGHNPKRARFQQLVGDPQVRLDWLKAVRDDGVALLQGVPTWPGAILQVVELFGFVRETNYGSLFDVITEEQPENLANSGMGLGLHTDNPYRDPVPQLQLLHCLEASEAGGESVVIDGWAVAETLRADAPEDFALLTRHTIPFRYKAKGVDLQARGRVIEVNDQGAVAALRYNNRSVAPFDLPIDVLEDYYRAYRRFGHMLQSDERFQVSFRLAPGDLFIVDNRRVLHGRKGFASGQRHLQGCYTDTDSLRSTIAVLEESLE